MRLEIHSDTAIVSLLESVTALAGIPMFKSGSDYLNDDGNNVFLNLHPQPDGFTILMTVRCRPELEKLDFIQQKMSKLKELLQEVFSDSHLPFKNRYLPQQG